MIQKVTILICLALLSVQSGGESLTVDGDALGHLRRLKQELGLPPRLARGRLPTIQVPHDGHGAATHLPLPNRSHAERLAASPLLRFVENALFCCFVWGERACGNVFCRRRLILWHLAVS